MHSLPILKQTLTNILGVVLLYAALVVDAIFINANFENIIILGFFAILALCNFSYFWDSANSFLKKTFYVAISLGLSLIFVMIGNGVFYMSTSTISGEYQTITTPGVPSVMNQ